MGIVKHYTNGEITVVWKPELCVHAANCVSGLPTVFAREQKPWVNMKGAATEQIIGTVDNCPTGALSYFRNNEAE